MSEQSAVLDAPAVSAESITEIALIDLSGMVHSAFALSGTQPDPDWTSQHVIERVRSLTANHPHAAICCDGGRTFRHDISAEYKAQRAAKPAALSHQMAIARERLQADGYPVWAAPGFEADDVIASAVAVALGLADTNVVIFSADKDLLQLVGPRVRAVSPATGKHYDEAAVVEKFGVKPSQMRDWLSLVGDSSDNVKGAKGIGAVKATNLLLTFESLDGVYAALDKGEAALQPAVTASLAEFRASLDTTRSLIELRSDVEIAFAEIFNERTAADAAQSEAAMAEVVEQEQASAPKAESSAAAPSAGQPSVPNGADSGQTATAPVAPQQALAVREAEILPPPAAEFEMQLEPRSTGQAFVLAKSMFASRLFSGYGNPDAVLSTIMAGREMGLQAIASLRAFHIVDGKHVLAADLIRARVLTSGLAVYFKNTERTDERATFKTLRKGEGEEEITLSFSVEDAKRAAGIIPELLTPKELELKMRSFMASGWGKNPADMCVARAGVKLARLVYPEVTHGLYAREEFEGSGNGN